MINILFIFVLLHTADSTKLDTTNRVPTFFSVITAKLIRGYQVVISPRQGEVCNFTPSCSHYAHEAIKKHGLLGVLMSFDRLERCNYSAWQYRDKYYKVKHIKDGRYKLYDPVKEY